MLPSTRLVVRCPGSWRRRERDMNRTSASGVRLASGATPTPAAQKPRSPSPDSCVPARPYSTDGRGEISRFFYETPVPVNDLMMLAVRGAGGPSH